MEAQYSARRSDIAIFKICRIKINSLELQNLPQDHVLKFQGNLKTSSLELQNMIREEVLKFQRISDIA
jgi:hypothetical protein